MHSKSEFIQSRIFIYQNIFYWILMSYLWASSRPIKYIFVFKCISSGPWSEQRNVKTPSNIIFKTDNNFNSKPEDWISSRISILDCNIKLFFGIAH